MTNREWLLNQMQNMSDEELACRMCKNDDGIGCKTADCNEFLKWLKAEHKEQIKLSDAERVILENIDKTYKWIVRFDCGRLFLANNLQKPYKDDNGDWLCYGVELDFYDHLFQFIKQEDEEPYEIEKLLKGE